MRFGKASVISSGLFLTIALPAFATPRVHRGPTAPHPSKAHASAAKPKIASLHGIEPERATQIQTALIKAGYLSGTPTGTWDAQSEAAMQKLQADNGWQTKLVPDARAIIKLGLGPGAPASAALTTPSEPSQPAQVKAEAPSSTTPS
jgi:hypothetical protein